MPLFSIIVVDYDGSVPRERARRGLASLAAQRFRDFEVIVLHDGPRTHGSCADDLAGLDLPLVRSTQTTTRIGDWGHSLRDAGLQLAQGEYIVHFNADNILYPEALARLAEERTRPVEEWVQVHDPGLGTTRPLAVDDPEIFLFPIIMRGMALVAGRLIRFPARENDLGLVLSGLPPVCHRIDCMQVVARRTLWQRIGGWYDKSADSDWKIYERLLAEAAPRYVNAILGEHW
ncbi:glycosyltransferase family 2 protein [Pararhodospirillum oryzae]|uniref:Glycosyltransferase 2-like domain-containing protein n=1 Tax=Pararhodospirillum oryzae TaxID=478448 RepID=A0A512H7V2_9PROT|nr:glycosyltransferase family 2 protein [Pararhodospirillum oryzae]GEO81532.1 hypothetical protein ROR02_16630 [Pararhodospirillum oryzae]